MNKKQLSILLLCLISVFTACSNNNGNTPNNDVPNSTSDKVVIAYLYGSFALPDNFTLPKGITHINYSFVEIKGNKINTFQENDAHNYEILRAIRDQREEDLNIMVSVGGWTKSHGFSDMCLTAESRSTFINSAVKYMLDNKIDGIDLDWEYPNLPGYGNPHRPEDTQNFTKLLKELRAALDEQGQKDNRKYYLTIAAAANRSYFENVETTEFYKPLDYVNLMTYDFYGPWGDRTGHQSALYDQTSGLGSDRSCEMAVNILLEANCPPEKVVLGVPFYGRGWKVAKAENNGLNQPAEEYLELNTNYHNLKQNVIGKDGYTYYWDEEAQNSYLWNAEKKHFVTFDDPKTMEVKANYILENDLGGVMFWQLANDTTFTLVNTLTKVLR